MLARPRLHAGKRIFLSTEQAASLVGRARREICCFCYGWLLPTHPDPDGYHLVAVKRYLRSREGGHVQALYWDYACVMQPPRTSEETAAFSDAIQTVADLYSSPLASCVLRNPFVPPRPDALDGVLALHHVSSRVTGSKLAEVLGSLGGTVKALHYDATFKLWRATLAYHQEAEKVVAGILKARHAFRTAEPGVSPGRLPIAVAALGRDMVATPWYNDRQLTGRAWTVFESNLAVEVTMCSCCFMLLRTQRRRPSPRPMVEHSAHTHRDSSFAYGPWVARRCLYAACCLHRRLLVSSTTRTPGRCAPILSCSCRPRSSISSTPTPSPRRRTNRQWGYAQDPTCATRCHRRPTASA